LIAPTTCIAAADPPGEHRGVKNRRPQHDPDDRGEASTPGTWPAGARIKKLSPVSGFTGNVEWGCTISNIAVTGNGSLKVGGGSDRIEEVDPRFDSKSLRLHLGPSRIWPVYLGLSAPILQAPRPLDKRGVLVGAIA